MILEWAIESIKEMKLTQTLGVKRIELCSSLDLGGLTPSIGLTQKCLESTNVKIHTMVRPRAGDFDYSDYEIAVMLNNIDHFATIGVHGVVFGALNKDHSLNETHLEKLIDRAKSHDLDVTFHRAFDFVTNPFGALNKLIDLKVDCILTSGQKPNAEHGINLIKELVNEANGKIKIIAGSGINALNAHLFLNFGLEAIHCTARKKIHQLTEIDMGNEYEPDQKKIEEIQKVLGF